MELLELGEGAEGAKAVEVDNGIDGLKDGNVAKCEVLSTISTERAIKAPHSLLTLPYVYSSVRESPSSFFSRMRWK